jgi:hypothetical protein
MGAHVGAEIQELRGCALLGGATTLSRSPSNSAKLVLGVTWEFEGEFGHPFLVGRHPRCAPRTNIGDDCAMIRVVMSRGTQTNAAILPTVGRPAEDIITLGGYPPPTSSTIVKCERVITCVEDGVGLGQTTGVTVFISFPGSDTALHQS